MDPATPSPDSSGRRELEAQVRECFGRVAYTHKTHEKQADLCSESARRLKWCQVVLSAVTTGGILAVLLRDESALKVAAAAVSTVLLAVTTLSKENRQSELAVKHRDVAAKLWVIRERYISLLADLRAGALENNEAREVRDDLMRQAGAVYASAPRTTSKAYKFAGLALKQEEELTFRDEEIDAFLPAPLRWKA